MTTSCHTDSSLNADLNAALRQLQNKNWPAVKKICNRILTQHPNDHRASHLLGVLARIQGDLRKSEAFLHQTIRLIPQNADVHNDLGLVLLEQKKYSLARTSFERAVQIKPHFVEAQLNLALTLENQGDLSKAYICLKRVLKHKPDYAKAHFCMGKVVYALQGAVNALPYFERAVALNPHYVAARNHLAICLSQNGHSDEALEQLIAATQINPHCAQTLCNTGNVLRTRHDFNGAIVMYRRALALDPDFIEAHFNLGLILLLLGDFDQGWQEYEWRLRQFPENSGYPLRYGLPLWHHESLADKSILVYDEQGFGDVFMFARYLGALKRAGAHVIFETRSSLIPLFRNSQLVDEVVNRNLNIKPQNACDYCIPLASLPERFNTTMEAIPWPGPYLHADAVKINYWTHQLHHDRIKMGLVWSGSNIDATRQCDLKQFTVLKKLDNTAWYGLQKESEQSPADWIFNYGPQLKDFDDTAALIASLDLIITIDTAVAHLSGAMGRPVWVLLPYVPDWRWLLDRIDSPWYPSMRLFRQDKQRDWTFVMQQIYNALKLHVKKG